MRYDILTIFPNMFNGFLSESLIKKAIDKNLISINLVDFRLFSTNKHHTVDDYAFSGGAGMLISVEPVHRALISIPNYQNAHKVYLSPQGKPLNQKKIEELAKYDHLIFICGHYEGIDNRILTYIDEEISIGDYILMGGEVPAMAIIEATARLVDGVISKESTLDESFSSDILEYPQYTHPRTYDNLSVPDILLSGDHAKIEEWKRYQALKKTYLVRPELLVNANLSEKDKKMLETIKKEINEG